jgi:hypothetical protein
MVPEEGATERIGAAEAGGEVVVPERDRAQLLAVDSPGLSASRRVSAPPLASCTDRRPRRGAAASWATLPLCLAVFAVCSGNEH